MKKTFLSSLIIGLLLISSTIIVTAKICRLFIYVDDDVSENYFYYNNFKNNIGNVIF